MNRGSLPFDARIDSRKLAEQLADALRRVHAKNVTTTPDTVRFTGGIFRFVSNWNILVPFTRGELFINVSARRLEYSVSFRQLIIFLSVFSVLCIGFSLASPFPWVMLPMSLAMTWLWLGGMNVLIGKQRFEQFLRTAIDATSVVAGG